MLCHQTLELFKRGDFEWHHNNNHGKFKDSFLARSAIRAKKVAELKVGLKAQQSLFTKPAAEYNAATEASFRIRHLLA